MNDNLLFIAGEPSFFLLSICPVSSTLIKKPFVPLTSIIGRNYHMILEECAHITKNIGADIKVLDMPLLDTRIEGKI